MLDQFSFSITMMNTFLTCAGPPSPPPDALLVAPLEPAPLDPAPLEPVPLDDPPELAPGDPLEPVGDDPLLEPPPPEDTPLPSGVAAPVLPPPPQLGRQRPNAAATNAANEP
jgi:hypothetical protein